MQVMIQEELLKNRVLYLLPLDRPLLSEQKILMLASNALLGVPSADARRQEWSDRVYKYLKYSKPETSKLYATLVQWKNDIINMFDSEDSLYSALFQ
jgi:hypothetical protein